MLNLTPATFEEFEGEAERGNVVPVVRTVLADLQTPVGAFLRIAGEASYACLLESIEGGERVARFSFIGADPWMVVRAQGAKTIVEKGNERQVLDQNGIDFLRQYFSTKKLAQRPGLAPLAGGAVGYLAYGAAHWFEPVLGKDDCAPDRNTAVWMFFKNIVAFDRVRQQMEITSVVFVDEAAGEKQKLRELYDRALTETEQIAQRLERETPLAPEQRSSCEPASREVNSNWARSD